MVIDFEGQDVNKDIILEQTTKYKARNLLQIMKGDINHLPNFGFNLDWFKGQTQRVLKLAISRYLMDYEVELQDMTMESLNKQGIFNITQQISAQPYRQGENNGL